MTRTVRYVDGAGANPEMRSFAGDLLHWSRDNHPVGSAAWLGALARRVVRVYASQRPAAWRVFQDSKRANHGNRHRVRDLSRSDTYASERVKRSPHGRVSRHQQLATGSDDYLAHNLAETNRREQ